MNAKLFILVTALVMLGTCRASLAQEIANIIIDTDRSVNCATLKTIVADVCKDSRTDQDKAIALYNFMVPHLTKAHVRSDPKMVDEIITLLEQLLAGWQKIAD